MVILNEFMFTIIHQLPFLFHSYYNWAVAAPMVLSMTTFQKSLPKVFNCFYARPSEMLIS